jgi:hypothetical protein
MNRRIKTLKIALAGLGKFAEKLEDIAEWQTGDSDTELTNEEKLRNKEHRRGIGWGMSKENVDTTKWIMEDSPGNWVFVIPDNVNNIEDKVKSDSFREWLQGRGYGEGYNIFVVGVAPFGADFSDPQWIVHDLVGHSVGNKFHDILKGYDVRYNRWVNKPDVIEAIDRVWSLLPPSLKNADETFDKEHDIAAGIIFGKINVEDAMNKISDIKSDNIELLKRDIRLMFVSANSWLGSQDWIQVGGNKVAIIYPWK